MVNTSKFRLWFQRIWWWFEDGFKPAVCPHCAHELVQIHGTFYWECPHCGLLL